MTFAIEFEMESDGRWIAEISELPGVLVYGATRQQAKSKVEALALRVLADKIEADSLDIGTISFAAA
jgi:predicted RNase H-like HicB family nuclease